MEIVKPKLTIPEQVEYMRDHCGITFNICSEENAISYLENSTYFFKIKAFAKVFSKNEEGKYENLDFAYLQELSVIDMHLRKEIFPIALDVEHYLKVWLIKDLSERDEEDGYSIVTEFFKKYPEIKDKIVWKSKSSLCKDLVESLEEKGYALWNVVELMSFGDFLKLYYFYAKKYSVRCKAHDLLFSVKCIRNAAAHNNCLINSLVVPYTREIIYTNSLDSRLNQIKELKGMPKRQMIKNPVIHDIAALLFAYDRIVMSKSAKQVSYKKLKHLFEVTLVRHKDYFVNNYTICQTYEFFTIIIDYLYKKSL